MIVYLAFQAVQCWLLYKVARQAPWPVTVLLILYGAAQANEHRQIDAALRWLRTRVQQIAKDLDAVQTKDGG